MNTTDVIEPAAPAAPPRRATVADLYDVEGKAELVGGRIVKLMGNGRLHSLVAANIYSSLRVYVRSSGRGEAHPDNAAFVVAELRSGRETFSPDACFYEGPFPDNEEEFIAGPPTFAVEVRSPSDYGPKPEREVADKRRDYFEAGTLVVWDVDPRVKTVAVYRRDSPEQPAVYRRGETAEAEPAAPGWRMAVDEIFA